MKDLEKDMPDIGLPPLDHIDEVGFEELVLAFYRQTAKDLLRANRALKRIGPNDPYYNLAKKDFDECSKILGTIATKKLASLSEKEAKAIIGGWTINNDKE